MEEAHDPYAVLRHRDYRRLLSAHVLASLGTEIQRVAVGWEIYQRTGEALALGLVGLVQFLPVLLLALPAGAAVDRYNRKLLMLGAQTVMGASALGLGLLSLAQGPLVLIYLLLLLAGCGRAFSMPARWALVPAVVPPNLLASAVTWNSSGWQIASVSGPALGGLLIGLTGQAADSYFITGACMLTAATLVSTLRPRPGPPPAADRSLGSLLAGVRFVWRSELILATITLDLFAVLLGGAAALLPVFAKDVLGVGPVGLGWLTAAEAFGALLMAMFLAHRPPLGRPGRALLWAVAGFGAAMIGFGLSENVYLSFGMLAFAGAMDNVSVVVRGTLLQVLTPDGMRGRVSAVNALFVTSSNYLGAFESGAAAQLVGPVVSVVGGGVGTILVVLAVAARWPQILHLGPLHRVQVIEPPGPEPPPPPEEGIREGRPRPDRDREEPDGYIQRPAGGNP